MMGTKAKSKLRGHSAYWATICRLDREQGHWTISQVAECSNGDSASVRDFVARLVRGGFAKLHHVTSLPKAAIPSYHLIDSTGPVPRIRRDGTVLPEPQNQSMWRAMRMAKSFTCEFIARNTTTPEREVKQHVARRYMRELAAAGILVGDSKGCRGVHKQFRLKRDLGPLAPKVLRMHAVFDPNSEAIIGNPQGIEVQP